MYPCHMLTDPTEKRPSAKLKFPRVEKKFSLFCGTQSFITAFTGSQHFFLILSPIKIFYAYPYYFLKMHFNIILTSVPRLCKQSFLPGIPTETLYLPLLSLYAPHAPPSSFISNSSRDYYLVKITKHEDNRYTVSSTFFLPRPT